MLKRMAVTLATVCALLALPTARAVWEYAQKPFVGSYQLYGGFPDRAHAASAGDIKLAINLADNSAKEMFNAIGPDIESHCDVRGFRLRQRDMLLCRYRAKDGYWCTFGFDLSTGLSIGGEVDGGSVKIKRRL
jgi:hypothetical protein